ncbi:putative S-adenosyl-L-methionine-dependent methyltransferase [Medicago truncatula]|uniref:DUF2431 domain protein n=1 Tax=Medicago truncatula TaxID=3880 RepID=G7KMJ1_MEDTR|nr:DUF2431 domain protein [Medicago truncatula]RHN52720.1 putative S-adenosyl-L-methionine-dependent methyltransferase [Medicago truncatula]
MEEKIVKHYSSFHNILLVGEGDFSFALCLAKAFGSAVNMVATSLDDRGSLAMKYRGAIRNLIELEGLGCTIMHEVDVHNMNQHHQLKHHNFFDRIIFNFPHSGFFQNESDAWVIGEHKKLVSGFLGSAKYMLNVGGEIHITHKTAHPFSNWNIKNLAENEKLLFIEEVTFYQHFYPGYGNKKGAGFKCDKSFPIGKCSTFKFGSLYYNFVL